MTIIRLEKTNGSKTNEAVRKFRAVVDTNNDAGEFERNINTALPEIPRCYRYDIRQSETDF